MSIINAVRRNNNAQYSLTGLMHVPAAVFWLIFSCWQILSEFKEK